MFQEIEDFLNDTNAQNVVLNVAKSGDKLTVVVSAIHPHQDKPPSDEAKAALSVPLTLKGYANDVDGGFESALKQYANNSKPNLDLLYTNASDAGNKKSTKAKDKQKEVKKAEAKADKTEAPSVAVEDPEEL